MRLGRFKILAISLLALFSLQVSALPGHAAHHAIHDAIHDAYGDHVAVSLCDLCHAYTFQSAVEFSDAVSFQYFTDIGSTLVWGELRSALSSIVFVQARGPPPKHVA